MPRPVGSEPCAEAARPDGYARRRPEGTLLHRLVSAHWPVLLARAEEQGGLPRFVVREMDQYLRCGILEHGLAAFQCARCGHERDWRVGGGSLDERVLDLVHGVVRPLRDVQAIARGERTHELPKPLAAAVPPKHPTPPLRPMRSPPHR